MSGLLFFGESGTGSQIQPDPVTFQSIPVVVSPSFPFENSMIQLSFPVNVTALEKTERTDHVTSTYMNAPGSTQIADIYRAMVKDHGQEQVLSDLLNELNKVRRIQKLSDDEYLELTGAYVQSLLYEYLKQNFAKFPAETIVDGDGYCDDKNLLFAGLLAREGYSVTLLTFEPESHMAAGVVSNDYLYKKTGYAFIETTNYSYIGSLQTDSKAT